MQPSEDTLFLEQLHDIFTTKVAFNEVLGMTIERLTMEEAVLRVDMQDRFVGNFVHGILHGGVISATLDVVGGITAFLGVVRRMERVSAEERLSKFSKLGTIDLRIDYLRPGKGKHFLATGEVIRTGSRVAVTRMEFHNDKQTLIAVGTGTYIVG